jgi:hypothetical protein
MKSIEPNEIGGWDQPESVSDFQGGRVLIRPSPLLLQGRDSGKFTNGPPPFRLTPLLPCGPHLGWFGKWSFSDSAFELSGVFSRVPPVSGRAQLSSKASVY